MARILLRKSKPENTRVKGELVRRLQQSLTDKGFSVGTIDGIFGGDSEKAVKAWQDKQGVNQDGIVTFDSWTSITGTAPPNWRERALQLTADFEGTGFGKIVGNFDGAWLTWGIIGFTLKHGELSKIIRRLNQDHPARLQEAFQGKLGELLAVMNAGPAEQEDFANRISLGQDRYKVDPEWARAFARLGEFPEAQAIQMERVDIYLERGAKDAQRFGMASELGLALCFDIAVQNGGIDFDKEENSIRQRLKQSPANGEIDIRLVVTEVIAENSNPAYAADVRSRKRTIATGTGIVHGARYDVGEWGLAEMAVGG
jgi:peptidoglycan hydrolase-like protein with peptidoglycan-binding domain